MWFYLEESHLSTYCSNLYFNVDWQWSITSLYNEVYKILILRKLLWKIVIHIYCTSAHTEGIWTSASSVSGSLSHFLWHKSTTVQKTITNLTHVFRGNSNRLNNTSVGVQAFRCIDSLKKKITHNQIFKQTLIRHNFYILPLVRLYNKPQIITNAK